jgi:hypothetical protein
LLQEFHKKGQLSPVAAADGSPRVSGNRRVRDKKKSAAGGIVIMKRVIVFLIITMLCACATNPQKISRGFAQDMDRWVGRSADALVGANGPPGNVFLLPSGGRIFEYLMTGIWTRAEESRLNIHRAGNLIPTPDTRGVRLGKPKKRVLGAARTCKVSFIVNADSIIENWEIDESSCSD